MVELSNRKLKKVRDIILKERNKNHLLKKQIHELNDIIFELNQNIEE